MEIQDTVSQRTQESSCLTAALALAMHGAFMIIYRGAPMHNTSNTPGKLLCCRQV